MKLLAGGDQHWTDKKPKNRLDNYFQTVLNKLTQEFQIAQDNGCEVLCLPGDLFDTFKESHGVVQAVMDVMLKFPSIKVLCVAGQHDQQFHNPNLSGTALHTLEKSEFVTVLYEDPVIIGDCAFYGASWKDIIPDIVTPDKTNILLIHKMIVDEKLWEQQEGHTWANHLLMSTSFDLIISGDNHQQFTATKGKKHLVNMGSMMRSTISQVLHKPGVCVFDSKKKSIDLIHLEVRDFDAVMCINKAEKEKEKNDKLDSFIASLKQETDVTERGVVVKLNFLDALDHYINKNAIPADVSDIIYDCIAS